MNRQQRQHIQAEIDKITRAHKAGTITMEQRRESARLQDLIAQDDARIEAHQEMNNSHADNDVPEIQGTPGEKLVRGQSFREYVRRAAENGVSVSSENRAPAPIVWHDDEYLNQYWGQRMGLATHESRVLNQDTGGSGVAVTPQAWTANVVEFLYAASVLGNLGVTTVPMPTEIFNVPVQTAPVQPSWLAESSSIGIDANPAFSTIQMNAKGGFKDITLYSREMAQDAYVQGTLPGFLAASCARNMALALDVAGIMGVAGNAGNPGLNAETGFVFRHWTTDAGTTGFAPVDTKELSIVNEIVKQANAVNTGWLCNNRVRGTIARTSTATAFPMFWPMPADVQDVPWVTTSNANVVPATETDPATASAVLQTTGTMSSLYAGPWYFGMLGVHLDLSTQPLTDRYADFAQVGLLSMLRASIRWANPQTFVRTIGILTT
jgi:HK97 family phage major capsid protein